MWMVRLTYSSPFKACEIEKESTITSKHLKFQIETTEIHAIDYILTGRLLVVVIIIFHD